MSNQQKPSIELIARALKGDVGLGEINVAIITAGQGTVGTAKGIAENVSENNIGDLVGSNSLCDLAFRAFREFDPDTKVDIVPLTAPVGTKAEATIGVAGSVVGAGTIRFQVADDRYDYKVRVEPTDTPETIVGKMADAIDANKQAPYVATKETSPTRVKIEYGYNGGLGNNLNIVIDSDVSGIQITSTDFSGGTGLYEYTHVMPLLQKKRYHVIIHDLMMGHDVIANFLEPRFNQRNAIMSGFSVTVRNEPYAEFEKIASEIQKDFVGKPDFDGKTVTIFANTDEQKCTAIPILMAAEFAAKVTRLVTEGVSLYGIYEPEDGSLGIGGMENNSLPLWNTQMSYFTPQGGLDLTSVDKLYSFGFSLITGDGEGGTVTAEVNTLNTKDDVFSSLSGFLTISAIKEYIFNRMKKKFFKSRLVIAGAVGGDIADETSIRREIVLIYDELVNRKLLASGDDNYVDFKKSLDIEVLPQKKTVQITMTLPIMSQLGVIIGYENFIFEMPRAA